jgi:hypothetical protein
MTNVIILLQDYHVEIVSLPTDRGAHISLAILRDVGYHSFEPQALEARYALDMKIRGIPRENERDLGHPLGASPSVGDPPAPWSESRQGRLKECCRVQADGNRPAFSRPDRETIADTLAFDPLLP